MDQMETLFIDWRERASKTLKGLQPGCHPKSVIAALSEGLLTHYEGKPLIGHYDVYQHLMDYWAEALQDDSYVIAATGWVAGSQPREIAKRKGISAPER